MKKALPSVFLGVLLGFFLGWLLGFLSPSPPPAGETTAKIAESSVPASPATSVPMATKTTPASAVAAPAAAPTKVIVTQPTTASASQAASQQAAFEKVRQQSQLKAMTNNLRMLSTASMQYMLDKGVTAASYFDLVGAGTDNYIRSVSPVAGEDYSGFYISQTETEVMIVAPNGVTAIYDL